MTSGPPCPDTRAIEVARLSHTYRGHRAALDDVNIQVAPGEVFAVLGPNGGGKTTLFRILCTMLRPTAGSAAVFGNDVTTSPQAVRRDLGVVFQSPSLDPQLSVEENLHHHGRLFGLGGGDLRRRIDSELTRFGLSGRNGDRTQHLSGGLRRRVELAKAMLHDPKLLLMDEPSSGLDPAARRDLWDRLCELRAERGMTVVLTTHLMDEADRCDRLSILAEGKLVALDTPGNLKAMIGGDVITAEPAADPGRLADKIEQQFGTKPTVVDGVVRWEQENGAETVAALGAAFPNQLRSITVAQPSLEDVFLRLTGDVFEAGGQWGTKGQKTQRTQRT